MTYTPEQLDQFAEGLAQGLPPGEAARLCGLNGVHGLHMLNVIRKKLGVQAK